MIYDKMLSVVLATHNEEENIARCLKSIKSIADEVIVVDVNSQDKTREIAEKLGAEVIKTLNRNMFHLNKQMAINKANGKWILQLDADEVVDDELRIDIKKVIRSNNVYNAYWIKRKNYFLGKFLTKGGQYPDPVIRLLKNGKAYLPCKDVHEQMEVDGAVGMLNGHLLHYNAPTFHRYITNANRYTTLKARQMMDRKLKINWANDVNYLLIKPFITFISIFIRHKGFVDGFPGFVFALFSGMHHALAYMKLGDLYRNESSH